MTRPRINVPLGAALLLLVLVASAVPVAAQERTQILLRPADGRGWLGIELAWESSAQDGQTILLVRQVVKGSPADEAGLAAGDRIHRFDGLTPHPERVQERAARLRPGESVVLEVSGPGGEEGRRLTLQAAERPALVAEAPGGEWVQLPADTAWLQLWRDLDASRMELGRWTFPPEPPHPFNFGEEFLSTLRLRGEFAAPSYILRTGQRVVAGAELTPVNPELGRYFGVESGVLAVEVLEDTPAARGGLRAGDVVVRVEGEPVTTVEEVRAALERGYREPPVLVTVVRERREVELSFPR